MLLVETSSTTYSFRDGVLVSELKPIALTKEHAIENYEARESLELDSSVPMLLDVRQLQDVTADGIIASGKFPDVERFTRVAFVVSSAIHEIMVMQGSKLEQNKIPTKVFKETDAAMRWLKQ